MYIRDRLVPYYICIFRAKTTENRNIFQSFCNSLFNIGLWKGGFFNRREIWAARTGQENRLLFFRKCYNPFIFNNFCFCCFETSSKPLLKLSEQSVLFLQHFLKQSLPFFGEAGKIFGPFLSVWPQASSTILSIARLALRRISSETRTSVLFSSSAQRTFSRVVRFMLGHVARSEAG